MADYTKHSPDALRDRLTRAKKEFGGPRDAKAREVHAQVEEALAKVLMEERLNIATAIHPGKVFDAILEQSAASQDGLTTYGELFATFFPGEKWIGNEPRSRMAKILDKITHVNSLATPRRHNATPQESRVGHCQS